MECGRNEGLALSIGRGKTAAEGVPTREAEKRGRGEGGLAKRMAGESVSGWRRATLLPTATGDVPHPLPTAEAAQSIRVLSRSTERC